MTPTATAAPTLDLKSEALKQIAATRRFFERSTRALEEGDSGFRATPETMTVASQVAHVAQTLDWFREGGFEDRWRTDWEAMPAEELAEPMAENPILPVRPRYQTLDGIVDHCAHHRGALAVYTRLLGRVPPMPYGDD